MRVGGQRRAAAGLPPRNGSGSHCTGVRDKSGRVRKISPPPIFDPRTVQAVACRNTDYTIPIHSRMCKVENHYNSVFAYDYQQTYSDSRMSPIAFNIHLSHVTITTPIMLIITTQRTLGNCLSFRYIKSLFFTFQPSELRYRKQPNL